MTHICKLSVVCSNGHLNPVIYKIILRVGSWGFSSVKVEGRMTQHPEENTCSVQHSMYDDSVYMRYHLLKWYRNLFSHRFVLSVFARSTYWAWSCLNNIQIGLLYCNGMKSPEHAWGPIWEPFGSISLPWRTGQLSSYNRKREEKKKNAKLEQLSWF